MDARLIVDSCCDFSRQLLEKIEAIQIPLTLRLGEEEFIDDDTLILQDFMARMKAHKGTVGSACPPPTAFQAAFEHDAPSFAVTLSSKLSGTYASAVSGQAMAQEHGFQNIFVLDSKSASAGETLLTLKLKAWLKENLEPEMIAEKARKFADEMKTYFVLENYDNLEKNGRLNRLAGKAINLLGIRLVMGSDGDGNIALFGKPRGEARMLERLIGLIEESGKNTAEEQLVISHCNNPRLAQKLHDLVVSKFHFQDIHIVPTGGLSSLYADDQGIILAF